jgi:hypothetical protein
MKNGQTKASFTNFTIPRVNSLISTAQLDKICRADNMGYIIQINALEHVIPQPDLKPLHPDIAAVLQECEDVFSETL